MTLPGIPTFIHGDELGYKSLEFAGLQRDGIFAAMNWTDEAPLYGFSTNPDAKNIDESQPTVPNNNILKGFKQLVKLRRLNRAFTLSKAFMMTSDSDVLVFQVQKTDRTYICAHNFAAVGKSIRICNEKVNNNPEVNFFEFITMANTTIPIDDGEYYVFDLLNNITLDILTVENGVYEYNTTLSQYGSLVARLIKV
jgi:glycosidase